MKRMKHILFLVIILSSIGCSSLELVIDPSEVEERAHAELVQFMKSEDVVSFINEYKRVHGQVIYDITLYSKGKVQTVFQASSDIDNIKFRNQLKDILKDYRFSFKMKKGKNYTIRHTFKF